jgi:hypothetical protein
MEIKYYRTNLLHHLSCLAGSKFLPSVFYRNLSFIRYFTDSHLWTPSRASWLQCTTLNRIALGYKYLSSYVFLCRFPALFILLMSRNSSVLTRLRAGLGFCTSDPSRVRPNVSPPSLLKVWGSFPRVKWLGLKAEHSLSLLEIIYSWRYGFTPQCVLMDWSLIKRRKNVAFPFRAGITDLGTPHKSNCGGPYQ